jgi:hypothetical protein
MTVDYHAGLDKDTVAILRKATKVSVHCTRYSNSEYNSYIRTENASGIESIIPITASIYNGYNSTISDNPKATMFIASARYCEVWVTAVDILKAGDKVSFRFERNYYRPMEGYQDLNLDTCKMRIQHGNKDYEFIIDMQLSKIDYPYPMIK